MIEEWILNDDSNTYICFMNTVLLLTEDLMLFN